MMHVCMYVCMNLCMYVWMDGWMDECMYECMYVCMYVCNDILIYAMFALCSCSPDLDILICWILLAKLRVYVRARKWGLIWIDATKNGN